MRNIHLALEGEESDLYSGYEYSDPVMDVSYSEWSLELIVSLCTYTLQELEDDPDFQRIVRTRYGNRPPLVVHIHIRSCGAYYIPTFRFH